LGSSLITLHLPSDFPSKPLIIILTSPILYPTDCHIAESREISFDCNVSPDNRIQLLRCLIYIYYKVKNIE
jgi:hypothetical protein